MSMSTVMAFLGWCSVLNVAILLFTTIALVAFRPLVARIHGALFGLEEAALLCAYFRYLAHYKIAIIMLNVVPYFALRIMS